MLTSFAVQVVQKELVSEFNKLVKKKPSLHTFTIEKAGSKFAKDKHSPAVYQDVTKMFEEGSLLV